MVSFLRLVFASHLALFPVAPALFYYCWFMATTKFALYRFTYIGKTDFACALLYTYTRTHTYTRLNEPK